MMANAVMSSMNMNVSMYCRPREQFGTFSSSFLTPLHSKIPGILSHRSVLGLKRKYHSKTWKHSMFISTKPVLKDGNISINGKDILTGVPDNVVVTPLTDTSAYVGATSSESNSRHVFNLGIIRDVRLMCLFRFKIFWMIPRVGNSGSDIPVETQMLLLEATGGDSPSYVVLLPVLDGEFRSSLQGNSSDQLELCVESGDPAIVTSQSLKAVFVNYGNHPFDLMKESMK